MIREFMESTGMTCRETAQFLNRHLGTNYSAHRVKEWAGQFGYIRREPPQSVTRFLRERMK